MQSHQLLSALWGDRLVPVAASTDFKSNSLADSAAKCGVGPCTQLRTSPRRSVNLKDSYTCMFICACNVHTKGKLEAISRARSFADTTCYSHTQSRTRSAQLKVVQTGHRTSRYPQLTLPTVMKPKTESRQPRLGIERRRHPQLASRRRRFMAFGQVSCAMKRDGIPVSLPHRVHFAAATDMGLSNPMLGQKSGTKR